MCKQRGCALTHFVFSHVYQTLWCHINQHQSTSIIFAILYIAVSPAERCPWKTARWSAVSQRSPSLCWVWRSTSAPAAISTCTAYERKSPVSVSSPSEYWCNPCLLLHGEHKYSSWWQQSPRSWGQQTSACFSPFHQKHWDTVILKYLDFGDNNILRVVDWRAFALDVVKNIMDEPTNKVFLGVG